VPETPVSFLSPLFAAAVAAVVIPALLILYFLKLRRREEIVPSTLLWKRAVQDLQVNAPFQRLRKSLLLFLQLAVLALAVLALARPIVQSTAMEADRLVLLIDQSASMNTQEADGTRLELAKEQAARLVRTLNRRNAGWRSFLTFGAAETRTQAMVIAFAERARIVSPFTTNTAELVGLIERIEPTDGGTDLREALELAEAYMSPPAMTTDQTPVPAASAARLILISDGRIAHLDEVVLKSGTLEFLRVGQTADNVGITALRTLRNYERPELLSIFLTVRNFGPAPIETDVSLYVDGTLTAVRSVRLAAQPPAATQPTAPPEALTEGSSAVSLSIELPLDRGAVLEARLARDDRLAVDNRAWAVIPPPRKLRVLTVTEKNYFLDSVLRGLPLEDFPFATPAQYEANAGQAYEADGASRFDVVIFDKVRPVRLPAGNFLFLGATPPLPGFPDGKPDENFAPIWWEETHPLLRHVALDGVVVARGLTLPVPRQAEVLIEGPRGPVLARYAAEGRHCVVLGFAVEQSNWWSKPSFPVFMYNAIRYLGGGAEAADGPLRPGQTLRFPAPAGVESLTLTRPDARTETLRVDTSGTAYYGNTDRVGVYAVDGGLPGRDRFAVNLEDERESDIAPPPGPLTIDRQPVAELNAIRTATPEVWRWFVGAALALLLFEWWVYNRRVML